MYLENWAVWTTAATHIQGPWTATYMVLTIDHVPQCPHWLHYFHQQHVSDSPTYHNIHTDFISLHTIPKMLSFYHKHSKRQKRIKTPKREETTRKHNRQENKRNNQTRKEEERREKEDGFMRISWLWKAPNLGLSIPQNNPSENSIGRNTRQQSICEANLWWLCKLIASSMQ